ncbi:P2Y purinoceptor 8-like [Eublepharis macularius]|uniref:P2Y purinoceptor 8-like n=1 Tax=Eublepharis macularius TaxID=481883 RepID=A0AA97KTF7_EUBMA|nr:P2Y purinoceptor 8-like [Eublepharis macularius]XP_054830315.1 P2Y purinoceptor 8-like [Eublepharis macularius]
MPHPQDLTISWSSRRYTELSAITPKGNVTNTTIEMLQSSMLQIALPILFSIIFSISVPLNCVSLWFLWWYSRPWTPIIVFSINLTIADLLYSMVLPFQIIYHLKKNNWLFGDTLCRVVTVLFYGNMHCSMLTMMSISIERYLGIVHPLHYKAMRPIRTSILTCVVIWALVLLPLIPLMKNNLTIHVQQLSIITCFDVLPQNMFEDVKHFIAYFGSKIFFFFFLPLIVMGFCYISIILTLLHSSSTQLREAKRHTVYLIIILLVVLCICYLPHIVVSVVHYVYTLEDKSFYAEYKLSLAMNSFNCCFDPLVYYFASKEFRQKIQKKLCRCVTTGFSENTPIFSDHDMQVIPIPNVPKK